MPFRICYYCLSVSSPFPLSDPPSIPSFPSIFFPLFPLFTQWRRVKAECKSFHYYSIKFVLPAGGGCSCFSFMWFFVEWRVEIAPNDPVRLPSAVGKDENYWLGWCGCVLSDQRVSFLSVVTKSILRTYFCTFLPFLFGSWKVQHYLYGLSFSYPASPPIWEHTAYL